MSSELIFVYNADSGLFSQVTDFAHKILSPQTYQCHLCALTYGSLAMKNDWKGFLKTIPFQKSFLHRDEFVKNFPSVSGNTFPLIFLNKGGTLKVLLSAAEINAQKDLSNLKRILQERLNTGNF
jgi:hypothetical protein